MSSASEAADFDLKTLAHNVAFVCRHCQTQYIGRSGREARYCIHCGMPRTGDAPSADTPESSRPRTVLLAEDSQVLRSAFSRMIRAMGHEVLEAVDGRDAWQQAQDRVPDLIITDLHMPKMGGLELIKRLHDHATLGDVPIVILTSESGSGAIAEGLSHNVVDYIVKDIGRVKEIRARLRRHL